MKKEYKLKRIIEGKFISIIKSPFLIIKRQIITIKSKSKAMNVLKYMFFLCLLLSFLFKWTINLNAEDLYVENDYGNYKLLSITEKNYYGNTREDSLASVSNIISETEYGPVKFEISNKYKLTVIISLIGLISIGAICIYLRDYLSAEIFTYDICKRRSSLGRVLVTKKGNILFVSLKDVITRKSETGYFEIHFSEAFIEKNRNNLLLIKSDKASYREIVSPIVYVSAYN